MVRLVNMTVRAVKPGRGCGVVRVLAVCLALRFVAAPACAQGLSVNPQTLLSRPLPGTLAREQYDLSRSLEQALVGFSGVKEAHVLITQESEHPSGSRRAAVQLKLTDGFSPTTPWVGAIADFVRQSVPRLASGDLTIVDASGQTLYSAGVVHVPPPLAVSPARPPLTHPWLIGAAGALSLVLIWLVLRRGSTPRSAPPEPREPAPSGPFGFLAGLSDEELATALRGERAAVVSAVLSRLPREVAARASRTLGATLPVGGTPEVAPEVLVALAEALRRKLAAGMR